MADKERPKPPNAGKGRPPGSVNKITAEIKSMAQEYGPAALKKLVDLMNNSDNDTVQMGAARELLDRAYGKSKQAVDVEANVHAAITEIRRTIVSPEHPHR